MTPGIEQPAIVMLAVDLDYERAKIAKQTRGDRRFRRQRHGSRRRLQCPADDQRLVGIDLNSLLNEQAERRVAGRKHDLRGHGSAILSGTHQPCVAARAEREAESI